MKKNRKKQIFLAAAALTAVIALLAGGYLTLRKGVYLGDSFYYRMGKTRYARNKTNYIELISDQEFKIVSRRGEKTVSLHSDQDTLEFTFSDGTSLSGLWNGVFFTDSDGFPYEYKEIQITTDDKPAKISNEAYCQVLCEIYFGKYETISAWYIQILGILFYIWGIVSIIYPDQVYFFLRKWQYKNPELSDAGRLLEQAGGAFLCLFGVGIMSGIILLLIH